MATQRMSLLGPTHDAMTKRLPHRSAEDTALVVATKNGDALAFDMLVRRHRTKILRLAMRFTRNREDAEDIVQQSLHNAFIRLHQFEGLSSFSTWLTTITMNEARMWLRKRRSAKEMPIDHPIAKNGATLSLDFPDLGLSPEDRYIQNEEKELLSAALNELTPRLRKTIELREICELSTGEVARALGLSVQAIKARVFHGRRKLQETLMRLTSRHNRLRIETGTNDSFGRNTTQPTELNAVENSNAGER